MFDYFPIPGGICILFLMYLTKIDIFVRQNLDEAAARAVMEEQRRIRTQTELQNHYRSDLEKEKMVTMPL